MNKRLIFAASANVIFLALVTVVSCSKKDNQQKQWIENIKKAEHELDSLRKIQSRVTDETFSLLALYINYADTYKQDSLAPVFLYRAAENSLYINQPLQAITYLKRIESEYPNFVNLGNVLFLTGFIYDNNLKNFHDAKTYYERFVEKFPEHPLANDTRFLLQHLGKSPEDLIKEFDAKNKQ